MDPVESASSRPREGTGTLTPTSAATVHVARQPIFDAAKRLIGYELLYRRDPSAMAADGERVTMSGEVIVAALLGIGLNQITGDKLAFVNVSEQQLLDGSWTLFNPASTVIELLEQVKCTPETLAACQRLVKAGYRLALDDYVPHPEMQPLVDIASIIKIDVLDRSVGDLGSVAKTLGRSRAKLLAERVETSAVRDACIRAGFTLFQGFLFSRPETLTRTDVSPGHLAIVRLLNLAQDSRTSDTRLERAFESDVALCYKLLRIVNTAALGGRGVTSIPHAIRLVGRAELHRWLCVLLVANTGRPGTLSAEMSRAALTRARMCELLAGKTAGRHQPASAFIVGVLSLLDVILEVPMEKILAEIQLSPEVRNALLGRHGPYGALLRLVEAYERGEWEAARSEARVLGVADDDLPSIYTTAFSWAAEHVTES